MPLTATKIVEDEWYLTIDEIVPDINWPLDFFGPKEVWSPRNLVAKKFGP